MRNDRRAIGREHEDKAAGHLLGLGYTLVTRRFSVPGGEIDIVALDGETLVFVEVKFRAREAPEGAVGWTKSKRMSLAVNAYLDKVGAQGRLTRCDLIAVTPESIRHYVGVL
jgi:putative endonuclease